MIVGGSGSSAALRLLRVWMITFGGVCTLSGGGA
jgi:hypothetical protein